MKFWKQVSYNAVIGIVVGGIVDLIDILIKRRKQWHGDIVCDPQHLYEVKNMHFDFDELKAIDAETGELLIDFSNCREPRKEMIKLLSTYKG